MGLAVTRPGLVAVGGVAAMVGRMVVHPMVAVVAVGLAVTAGMVSVVVVLLAVVVGRSLMVRTATAVQAGQVVGVVRREPRLPWRRSSAKD